MNTEQLAALAGAIERLASQGRQQVGWKLGFGSAQGLELLGLDRPLVAALFDTGFVEPGSLIDVADLSNPMVEPEIAAWIGQDCAADASPQDLISAVDCLVPAIELADVCFPPADPCEVLAGNIYQASWMAPVADASGWGSGGDRRVDVVLAGETWEQSDPESMTGSLVEGLVECNSVAHALGRGLRAGDIVFLGSVIPPQKVVNGSFSNTFDDGRGIDAVFVGARV